MCRANKFRRFRRHGSKGEGPESIFQLFILGHPLLSNTMKKSFTIICFLFFTTCFTHAQILEELLEQAETNYPLLKAKGFEIQAGRDQLLFAKSAAMPSLDATYQVNYATQNNITGMAVTEGFVPISGPPSAGNDYTGVFGSAGGFLLNWEPFTFGQRKSNIESAKAYVEYQEADAAQEIFQHQVRTANAYLDVVMAEELIKVYSKNLERAKENLRIVRSLTLSGLRPGVDTALFNAELSRARIELLNYQKLKETQQLLLSELLGGSRDEFLIDSSYFKKLPVIRERNEPNDHPLIALSASRVKINQYEKTALQRTLNPTLSLWGTAYARGSGIRYDGYINAQDGLSFTRYNYGAGLVLSVPLLRFTHVRHQVNEQEALIHAAQESLNFVTLQLEKQNEVANVTLENALEIAHESPRFLQSAEFGYRTLLSRYNSGLVNYADLVQAQYTLIRGEVDFKKSYLDAWKALLFKAAVEGDLQIFLNQL